MPYEGSSPRGGRNFRHGNVGMQGRMDGRVQPDGNPYPLQIIVLDIWTFSKVFVCRLLGSFFFLGCFGLQFLLFSLTWSVISVGFDSGIVTGERRVFPSGGWEREREREREIAVRRSG